MKQALLGLIFLAGISLHPATAQRTLHHLFADSDTTGLHPNVVDFMVDPEIQCSAPKLWEAYLEKSKLNSCDTCKISIPQITNLELLRSHVKYPKYCAENGIGGKVLVALLFDRSGTVIHHNIHRNPHPLLTLEFLKAAYQLKAEAIERDQNSWVTIPIDFNPSHSSKKKKKGSR